MDLLKDIANWFGEVRSAASEKTAVAGVFGALTGGLIGVLGGPVGVVCGLVIGGVVVALLSSVIEWGIRQRKDLEAQKKQIAKLEDILAALGAELESWISLTQEFGAIIREKDQLIRGKDQLIRDKDQLIVNGKSRESRLMEAIVLLKRTLRQVQDANGVLQQVQVDLMAELADIKSEPLRVHVEKELAVTNAIREHNTANQQQLSKLCEELTKCHELLDEQDEIISAMDKGLSEQQAELERLRVENRQYLDANNLLMNFIIALLGAGGKCLARPTPGNIQIFKDTFTQGLDSLITTVPAGIQGELTSSAGAFASQLSYMSEQTQNRYSAALGVSRIMNNLISDTTSGFAAILPAASSAKSGEHEHYDSPLSSCLSSMHESANDHQPSAGSHQEPAIRSRTL